MADTILLIFEGAKTESDILLNLQKHYSFRNSVIYASFEADIYQLWKMVEDDKDKELDMLEILKERERKTRDNKTRNNKNRVKLTDISRDDISQIFLFFDYDGHATQASDEAIEGMLAHFTNETDEHGKLYISYPMVEAIKHLKVDVDFKDVFVSAKETIKCEVTYESYKQLVNRSTSYLHFKKLTKDDWNHIILKNFKKANFIVNNLWEKPEYNEIHVLNQNDIFNHQLQKYITIKGKVAVLSAFPFFIIEYFGEKEFNLLTNNAD